MQVLEGETMPIFRGAVRSKYTRDHYERHLRYFFEFSNTKADSFVEKSKRDPSWTEKQIVLYIRWLMSRVEKSKEAKDHIEASSVSNYIKPLRLFLEMNDIILNWKKLNRLLPTGRAKSKDRSPTVEEIREICEYPDRRIKAIVLSMISGGFRLGAWDYLTWGDVEPIEREGKLIAAKVTIYGGEPEEYFTFITPEAYTELKSYIDFRQASGERISKKSYLIRDLWKGDKGGKGEPHIPKPLRSGGIKSLIEKALWTQGIRKKLAPGEKRHEFKTDHGFRKFHETMCINAGMEIVRIKILRGDSIELEDHYYRPSEKVLLTDYEKAIPTLTLFSKVTVLVSEDVESLRKRISLLEAAMKQLEGKIQNIRKIAASS